jgi:putative transposase
LKSGTLPGRWSWQRKNSQTGVPMKTNIKEVKKEQAIKLSLEEMREMTSEMLQDKVKASALEYVARLMNEEVDQLCGRLFSHKANGNYAHRGGSDKGSVIINGNRVSISKPRVRKDNEEYPLNRYKKLHSTDNLSTLIFAMMLNGVSTRSYDKIIQKFQKGLGVSKSLASKKFIKESRKSLNEINERKFEGKEFFALFIDGTNFGGDTVLVALGVDLQGNKHFIGILQGSSENAEIVSELLANIKERQIKFSCNVICVLDGAKALRKGVVDHFGESADIQRCLNHKVRNVEAKLDKKYHSAFNRRIHQAYSLNNYSECKTSMNDIVKWLSDISHNASESLKEGMDDLLTLHRIGMPPELRKSFYTSNPIDSAFSSTKLRTMRVKRWNKKTDMIKRWASTHLLEQEKTFRKVNAFGMIDLFLINYLSLDKKVAA